MSHETITTETDTSHRVVDTTRTRYDGTRYHTACGELIKELGGAGREPRDITYSGEEAETPGERCQNCDWPEPEPGDDHTDNEE